MVEFLVSLKQNEAVRQGANLKAPWRKVAESCCLAVAISFASAVGIRGNPVLEWGALTIDAIRVDNSSPTLSSRNLAILHTAIYDAVNSIQGTHQPYKFQVSPLGEASVDAAATAAARVVLEKLYPGFTARAEVLYQRFIKASPANAALTNGLAVGHQVALMALESRESDGANTEVTYIPSDKPGAWRRTPPFFRPPLTPHWRYVKPFGLPEVESFLPPPPPALNSPDYAEAVNMLKRLGGKASTERTAEQGQIALFWSDFSYTAMPPGHWDLIAADIARQFGVSTADTARLFALVGMAQADAAIVCWEAKYRHNLWRPVTAIQRAGEDENPLTEADPDWDHLLGSPPFPAYTSGHSTFSKASAEVLARFFGTDAISFNATSDSLPGVLRHFESLSACADEVGMSRIYGGIHFPFDNTAGKASGQKIAEHVVENYLLPVSELPVVRVEWSGANAARLRVHGRVGGLCVLEESADLARWQPLSTNLSISGGVVCAGQAENGLAKRYYRARAIP